MTSQLIGIMGKKRSGKDTFAAALVEQHGFTRIAFADPLKATMLYLDPWVKIERDEGGIFFGPGTALLNSYHFRLTEVISSLGWEKAKEIREVRRLLQAHGVGIREHVDPDVWVDAAMTKAHGVAGPVVVTDVRFPNEAERIKFDGGTLVRIIRPDLVSTDTHVSETALDETPSDYDVINGSSIESLRSAASALVGVL